MKTARTRRPICCSNTMTPIHCLNAMALIVFVNQLNNSIMPQPHLLRSSSEASGNFSPPVLTNKNHSATVNHTTLKDIVKCEGDFRNLPVHIQDRMNEVMGHAMMRDPSVEVLNDKPPALPDTLCDAPPFVGRNTKKQPLLFLAYMFSHEIELLEARLYEGMDGVVDRHFVAESGYTHRGHRKRKFASDLLKTKRFERFRDVVEIVDLDQCPEYLEEAIKYRNMGPRPRVIWATQGAAQGCLAKAVRAYADANNVGDAMVQVSDLDEVPYRAALASVKECELPASSHFPLSFSTTKNSAGKLCRPLVNQQIDGMLFRAGNMTGQRRPDKSSIRDPARCILGGVHLTYFGGSLVYYFKSTNHAEGGGLTTLGWLTDKYNPTICNASADDWYRREELMCTDTGTVIQPWIKSPTRNERVSVTAEDADLPWVIAKNRDRYPCFFADTRTCVDTYIDIML